MRAVPLPVVQPFRLGLPPLIFADLLYLLDEDVAALLIAGDAVGVAVPGEIADGELGADP